MGRNGPLVDRFIKPASQGTTAGTAAAAAPEPVTVAPGETATITVTITPTAAKGTVVHGHLYIDTFSQVTFSGDELIDLPYTYTVS